MNLGQVTDQLLSHAVGKYQLMAGLVAEAMSHAAQLELRQALAAEDGKEHVHSAEAQRASEAERGELSVFRRSAGVAAMIAQAAKRLLLHQYRLHQYRLKPAAVVIVLVMAGWIAYTRRGPASPVSTSALPRSNASSRHLLHPRSRRRTARPSRRRRELQRKRRRRLPGPRR